MSPLIASSLINKAASRRFLSLIGNRLAVSKQTLLAVGTAPEPPCGPSPAGLLLGIQSLPSLPGDGIWMEREDFMAEDL